MSAALDAIRHMESDVITPRIAATVLHCDPYSINVAARDCPGDLGFPIIRIGKRVKIPRLAFLAYMEGRGACGKT